MWPRAATLIAAGYLVPLVWLWWVTENPPARARGEFGAFGLLGDVYWLLWIAFAACSLGLAFALRALNRESIVLTLTLLGCVARLNTRRT
jgi:hypothetical protein